MKINIKISLQQFLNVSEAEIEGLLYLAQANLGFQSLQLPSAQPGSPLAPKCHVYFLSIHSNCEENFLIFHILIAIIRIRINCNRISEGLQCHNWKTPLNSWTRIL